jgi:Ni,Fe-hydrogenase III large subunit
MFIRGPTICAYLSILHTATSGDGIEESSGVDVAESVSPYPPYLSS